MKICETIGEMRRECRGARDRGLRVGLVPTMGALHEGHLSLVRAARESCQFVAASIFVNPTQFGPSEDLARYPRSFAQDCAMLEKEKVDLVFAPSVEEMYPAGAVSWVTVEGLSEKLDGRSRPGHFRGVATVVAKLFHIVEPDAAFFGQKDAAQVAIIRKMVQDLNFAVQVVARPIAREADGVAMSSRNVYLNAEERKQALVLHRALLRVQDAWESGEHEAGKLLKVGKVEVAKETGVRLDYFEIVDAGSLEPVETAGSGMLVAVAAWVGSTRLIDNFVFGAESEDPSHKGH